MAIKEKNQPAAAVPPPLNGVSSSKTDFIINPELNARLDKFMADNPQITEHYTKLVKEHPDRAIRSFALRSMFRHEEIAHKNALQMPQVKQWVDQHPGLEQQITSKIKTTNPIMRAAVFIKEAIRVKGNIEFAPPAPRVGTGISV
jgi:hypothetical protein